MSKSRCTMSYLTFPFYLKAGHKFPRGNLRSLKQEEENILITRNKELMPRWNRANKPTKQPLSFISFPCIFPSHFPTVPPPPAQTPFALVLSHLQYRPFFVKIVAQVFRPTDFFEGSYAMEKAMAPHSSTLAWKIPWMEEHGRLQSMGLLRVGHDWATSLSLFTFMHWRRKWQPTPVFLPEESQGQGSLVSCHLWGHTESDTTEAT